MNRFLVIADPDSLTALKDGEALIGLKDEVKLFEDPLSYRSFSTYYFHSQFAMPKRLVQVDRQDRMPVMDTTCNLR